MPTQITYKNPGQQGQEEVNDLNPFPVKLYDGGSFDQVAKVERVEQQFSYTYSAGSETKLVKSGPGFLHLINVNTTAASTITIFDSVTGAGQKIGILKASIAEGPQQYDVAFNIGLTIVLAGASDITVSWR